MEKDLLSASARTLLSDYRSGRLSPVEVTKACLRQALKCNPALGAFCFIDEAAALRQARASERRWKNGAAAGGLDGVPVTVKDWYDARGWPTRYGSLISSTRPQTQDSPPVASLRGGRGARPADGAVPKLRLQGRDGQPLCGAPTRNPWNSARTPGGSSGGAAVAAATGMAPLNLGSDAGGSIRIPASFTGVVGVKPSPGLVPTWPPSVFASLSALGPLARSVEDAALMLDALMRPDASDWNALPVPRPALAAALRKPLRRLRGCWAPSINGVKARKDARKVFAAKIRLLVRSVTSRRSSCAAPS